MPYFRLFRVVNLLIIALIMVFFRFFLFEAALGYENTVSPISDWQFIWLVTTFVVLTAGGYAINDYYDIGMDEINNPKKTVLRNKLPLSAGQNWFFILTAIGVVSGCGLAWTLKSTSLYFMPVFVAALYWFYTTKYKREFISGNLVVSFLASLNIGLIYIYYILSFRAVGDFPVLMFPYMTKMVIIYASFAFFITFIREVVKDILDMEGDKEFDCQNIPIRYGISTTKIILLILSFMFLLALVWFAYYSYQLSKSYLLYYILVLLIPLWIFIIRNLWKAREKKDFKELASFLKIYMVAGIVSIQLLDMSNMYR